MKFRNSLRAAVTAAALIAAPASAAVILDVDVNGQLLGASGVEVDGEFYNVEFLAGTCAQVFSGCDEQSDFITTDATQFAQALLNQVLLDGPDGLFDSQPELTNGCQNLYSCVVMVPDGFTGPARTSFQSISAANASPDNPVSNDELRTSNGSVFLDFSQPSSQSFTFARFTQAEATEVPAPAALGLLGLGLAGLGFARTRRMGR